MGKSASRLRKLFLACAACVAFFGLACAEARADEVYIAGYTGGCMFPSGGCTVGATPDATTVFLAPGLSFTNSAFEGSTVNGQLALTAGASPGSNFNNLGSFTLSAAPGVYNGEAFIEVLFTNPDGVDNAATRTFRATITGEVRDDGTGTVIIDFFVDGDEGRIITFRDPRCDPEFEETPGQQTTCGAGQFFIKVNDLRVEAGQTVALTALITGAQQSAIIPEPTTLLLLGTGLAGVAFKARRARRRPGGCAW